MRVAVIGLGYVGLPTAAVLAYVGHDVVGVETDSHKLSLLMQGNVPLYEPGLQDLMSAASHRLRFSESPAAAVSDSDAIIVAVGTPQTSSGRADLRQLTAAIAAITAGFRRGKEYTLITKSTVPVGSSRLVDKTAKKALGSEADLVKVHFASNPEFLREGLAVADSLYPDRVIVGSDDPAALETVRRIYAPILEQEFEPLSFVGGHRSKPDYVATGFENAEFIKYASNAFLALKISFANEMAGLCEHLGADVSEVMRGVGLDRRIGRGFLGAGLGWGGSCFPKDTAALLAMAAEHGDDLPIIRAAVARNDHQVEVVIRKLQRSLQSLRGRVIGVLGLAFKPNTDDTRESPALKLIEDLLAQGAFVQAHDPVAAPQALKVFGNNPAFTTEEDPYKVAEGADGLVVATDWDAYRQLDLGRLAGCMQTKVIIDGRNILNPEGAREQGFRYQGVGR